MCLTRFITIVVVTGAIGAGKTTWARRLVKQNPNKYSLVDSDFSSQSLVGYNSMGFGSERNAVFSSQIRLIIAHGKIPVIACSGFQIIDIVKSDIRATFDDVDHIRVIHFKSAIEDPSEIVSITTETTVQRIATGYFKVPAKSSEAAFVKMIVDKSLTNVAMFQTKMSEGFKGISGVTYEPHWWDRGTDPHFLETEPNIRTETVRANQIRVMATYNSPSGDVFSGHVTYAYVGGEGAVFETPDMFVEPLTLVCKTYEVTMDNKYAGTLIIVDSAAHKYFPAQDAHITVKVSSPFTPADCKTFANMINNGGDANGLVFRHTEDVDVTFHSVVMIAGKSSNVFKRK